MTARGASHKSRYSGILVSGTGEDAFSLGLQFTLAERLEIRGYICPIALLKTVVRVPHHAGDLDPMRAMMDGQLVVEGDLALAGRLGDMFGAAPRT